MIDFFCKNIAASSYCDDRKFAIRIRESRQIYFGRSCDIAETRTGRAEG